MSYCHVTYETNKYLDRLDYWTRVEEEYEESEQYQEDLEEFDGTEEEYLKSNAYDSNVEAYEQDCITYAY
tara:strand:+ start:395 stop:604 length:210 start_codon:yes stop_codon:yes gene_type:complete